MTRASAIRGRGVIVVGAGLAGPLLAIYLAKLGARVRLFERRADPLAKGYAGGRSINLALSCRGLTALRGAGLDHVVTEHALPMRARMIHPVAGELNRQPYSSDGEHAIMSVSRGGLNAALVRAARDLSGVDGSIECRFEHVCTSVDVGRAEAEFRDAAGNTVRESADLIIGADGAFSAVREGVTRARNVDHSLSFLTHGYKELTIPALADLTDLSASDAARWGGRDGFAMDPGCLHIWPRGGSMMIALPNPDRSFTVTLFWPFDGAGGFNEVDALNDDGLIEHFRRTYPDSVPLLPALVSEYRANPTGSLVTVRCFPWHAGRVMVIGDAAHAIVPFFGQGMNCAFEDCRILAEMLGDSDDLDATIRAFERERKPDADAIADLALENFIEMRDKVASPIFRAQQRVNHFMERVLPGRWLARYHMVSFTNIPYADARARAARQWHVLILAGLGAAVMLGVLIDLLVGFRFGMSAIVALGLFVVVFILLTARKG